MRPEDYWINLGENVIGQDVLADGDKARQAATYQAIAKLIFELEAYSSVLDIGCNYGILEIQLLSLAWRGYYRGIDTNPYAIQLGESLGNHVMVGDLHDLSTQILFDIVIIKDVIEHLENIEPLKKAFRVAHQYLILSLYLPLHDAPTQIVHNPAGYYTNTYNRQDVMRLAKECGFILVRNFRTKETNGTDNEIIVWGRDAN